MIRAQVSAEDDGVRLDRWFKRHYPQLPHAMLEKYLRKGQVRVQGAKVKAGARVARGQEIQFPPMPDDAAMPLRKMPAVTPQQAEDARGWVLYKDARIIVMNKPAGLAVQGGSGQMRHVDGLLSALRFDASAPPKLVHRLDKDTSGALVLARDAKTAAELAERFAGEGVRKTYLALVRGVPRPQAGTIDLPLAKLARGKFSREQVEVEEGEGKQAVTEYRVREALAQKLAWMELKPITGRTHQLRVHMAAIGHPIIGDGKYGGERAYIEGIAPRLHLHAWKLELAGWHGKNICVTAPLSPHMQHSTELLGIAHG